MEIMDIVNLIVAIVSGIATCIPLVIQLGKYIKENAKSKNWSALMALVLNLMQEAEFKFTTGEERKQFVLSSIKSMEGTLNYDIDETVVASMIDSIIAMSNTISKKDK
jgi:hypothetical protein